jgi:hypothetical protein
VAVFIFYDRGWCCAKSPSGLFIRFGELPGGSMWPHCAAPDGPLKSIFNGRLERNGPQMSQKGPQSGPGKRRRGQYRCKAKRIPECLLYST